MFRDDLKPVYVATDDNDEAVGYVFCQRREPPFMATMVPCRTLFIDDFCVDESQRGKHIGETLFRFAVAEAQRMGCREVALNVWEGNTGARRFYEKMGMRPKETQMEFMV